MSTKSTKKNREIANDLFAQNGFAGTSIRDIASAADVNLSAVNYHFTNKEQLYWEVFQYNFSWIGSSIEKLGEESHSTAELTIKTFKLFISEKSAMLNIFKMFISDKIPVASKNFCEKERIGPPGEDTFLHKIKSDLGSDIPIEGQKWAVRMIFSLIVHFGVIMNTPAMRERCKNEPSLKPKILEDSLAHSVKAHLDYLKKHAALFKS
ncbi:MAG: TetR/AcrR family transcriptional regulator [Bdellovibrionota bacterium]